MQIVKNKTMAILIISIIMISMSAAIVLSPPVNAHTPPWTIISYAYVVAAPNPIGVGQTTAINLWIDTPMVGATVSNDIRRHDYTLTITKPNGDVETKHWDVITDTTSVQYLQYTPDQVGNYTLKFVYPDQEYIWSGQYQGDIIKGANRTITMTVQEDPIPAANWQLPFANGILDTPH